MILLTFMILGMVVLGGLTRLTGAGLSIVEWKPIVGILPPLTANDWLLEFSKYKQSPEFQKINFSMALEDFQSIFWLEYIHRLWGRLLALILLVPTFLMIFKKQYLNLWPYLALLWIFGLSQGLMGWLMVKSGLAHDPHVSPYRLSAHLLLGFALFGISLWMTLKLYQLPLQLLRQGYSESAYQKLMKLCLGAIMFVLLTAFMGALVAGLKAGLLYNTFPLMGNDLIPPEIFSRDPWWQDAFENPVTVQFFHRLLALITAAFCLGIWTYQRKHLIPTRLSRVLGSVAVVAFLQVFFGYRNPSFRCSYRNSRSSSRICFYFVWKSSLYSFSDLHS
ncbi:COX15/CtaA family protein [Kamptonema cortianum]|nr:COX15/CtaA family protein [Kamptonema cortianum]